MRGGGRRSPPLTRRSSGGDVPHFDHPPARVNAGYQAVNRDPDGKFPSFHGGQSVQTVVVAPNDPVGGNLEGGSAGREVEEKHSMGCNGADSGGLCSSQPKRADLGVNGGGCLEPRFGRDAALFGCDIHPPSNPNPSHTSSAAAMEDLGLDLEDPSGTLLRTTAVCENVSMENSCTGAGNSFYNMRNVHAGGCVAPSPPSPNNPASSRDVLGADMDDVMGDPNSTSGVATAGCNVDSNISGKLGAGNSVWTKPGVTPLPSLKDLPHLAPIAGVAQLDEEESNMYMSHFDAAIVGRLFGRHIPFYHLQIELRRRWDRFGSFRLITLSNECFICFFSEVKARDAVLMGGPWNIAGQVLGLDRWTPGFSPSTQHGFITPVWVRFPELPFYCWGVKNLASISSILGEPLWVDDATLGMTRGSFARVCIKIDLSQPLVPSVWVQGKEGPFKQQIEYEGLTSFCTKCGRVGHKNIHCNPTLAAGGRPETGKKTQHILNKAKSIGRAPIFGFSATSGSTAPPPIGKSSTSHPASGNKIPTPLPGSEPPHEPMLEEEQDGAGPWKVVPTRRRGRRLRHHPQRENAAVHDTNSSPSRPLQQGTQAQVADPPPIHLGKHLDSPEQHTTVDLEPSQHGISGAPRTTFTHRTAPFTSGSRGNRPPPRGGGNRGKQPMHHASRKPSRESYYFSDDTGKFKKRKPATQPNDEDASSDSPG